jgi:outer membrane biosynthesis protein TonB
MINLNYYTMNLDQRGIIGTIAFHVIILLLFIIFGFRTPLPLPAEQGILINFGDSESGSGPQEPRYNEERVQTTPPPPVEEVSPETKAEESVMTQEHEEAPVMASAKKTEKKKEEQKKEDPEPVIKKTETKPVEKKEEPKPTVDSRAMYRGKKTDTEQTGSEGVTQGEGNQGSPTGSEDATNRSLGLSGGDGIRADLTGRNPVHLTTPEFDIQKEGIVKVEIQVDRSGKVVSAVPGVKGSTTLDSYLLGVAKRAALSSRFDNKPDAQYIQTGTITYIFKLK